MVNEKRMRETFEELVRIYAPSKGEREVCDLLKKKLKALGASEIIEDNNGSVGGGDSGNLIAVFPANAEGLPSVALTAHMDCVECCRGIDPVLEDGVYRSRGGTILGSDDKAGVAAILEGLALMKENFIPHGKVTAIFTVQEEIGLVGSKNIEEKYLQDIDFGYTFDADGEAGHVFTAGPSHYAMKFTFHGKAAHAGMEPEKGLNAIAMAAKAIASCPSGRIDEETTCNIGTITGGRATNIIPELCVVEAEARSRDEGKLEKLVGEIVAAFENAAGTFPSGTLEIEKVKEYDAFRIEETAPLMNLFRMACKEAGFAVKTAPYITGFVSIEGRVRCKEAGFAVKTAPCGGGSDANFFCVKGFPSVLVGVGMTDFHTNRESLREKDLYDAGELVYRLLEAESHFAGESEA